MDKFLSILGLGILLLLLWHVDGKTSFESEANCDGQFVHHSSPVYRPEGTVRPFFLLTFSSQAEVAENTGRTYFLNNLRVQRLSAADYLFMLQHCVCVLARRCDALLLHRERLERLLSARLVPDDGGGHGVFALEKILI